MKVPSWLKKRSIVEGVPKDIKEFARASKIQSFEHISIDLLKIYYETNDRKSFFKMVRLLGFYGVHFYNKLKAYSGPIDDNPKVIFVPNNNRNDLIADIDINSNIKTPLISCGIIFLKYLHGVPLDCVNRLLGSDFIDFEPYLISLLKIIPANEVVNSFLYLKNLPSDASDEIQFDKVPVDSNDSMRNFLKVESDIPSEEYSIESLNFSVRTKHCLKKSNISSINQLITSTETGLLSIQFFGKKCLDEVKTKLEASGLRLGTTQSKNLNLVSIDCLNLSKRPRNCLLKAGIENINQLINKNQNEIYSLKGMGRTSYNEINEKINKYLAPEARDRNPISIDGVIDNSISNAISLRDEKTLINLKTSVHDIVMTLRSRNALRNVKIEYIWQLIRYTEKDLLKIKNFGRKSLNEIKDIIADMSFNFGSDFSPEEIDIIIAYEKVFNEKSFHKWFKDRVAEIRDNAYDFLSEKEKFIAQRRIFEVKIAKNTLEEISDTFGMTRERIRQLEGKALRKLRREYQPELREVISVIFSKLEASGKILNLSDFNIDFSFVSSKNREIVNQLIGLATDKIFVDWKCSLISSEGPGYIDELCDDIQNEIFVAHKEELFTTTMLAQAVKNVCDKRKIFSNGEYSNLTKKFLTKNKVSREGRYLSIGKMKKIEKIALAFKILYPKGLEVHKNQDELLSKIKEYDPFMFKGATQRSIIARLTAHSNVLLWGRGFFVHESNISYDLTFVNKVIALILNHFDKGHYRFQIGVPFSKYKDKLIGSGVPNQYALYSLIRKQEIDRIGQRKYPTIVDLEANVNIEEGILEELEAFFKDQKREVQYEEIKTEFVKKRGWKEYSVQQNLCTHSELIYPWKNNSYIHLDFLDVDYSKLKDLISSLKDKLNQINGPYNLKGAKTDMNLLWEQTCPSATTRTIAKLIRQADYEDLVIDHNFIRFVDTPPESVSIVGALEEFFVEKNTIISRYELKEEFVASRGWTENQFYTAIRNANLFQTGKNTFIHPSTIMWNEKLSQEVHQILTDYLKERNRSQQPHMQIEELIYEYVLPELPNSIEWSRYLLVSVGEELKDFLFFDDAYVFVDNDLDIQDLDDMIAFLIAKEFPYGLAKAKEIEELLWREGILASGLKIPKNQFFEGSSISFSDFTDEISLSAIGKLKYGNIK